MTTVTLETDDALLAKANEAIARRQMTLNDVFEQALRQITEGDDRVRQFDESMRKLRHIDSGGPYTRDEMHEH